MYGEPIDPLFYCELYPELKGYSDVELVEHWRREGQVLGWLSSASYFYELYPHFDLISYKEHSSVRSLSIPQTLHHYHTIGHREGYTCTPPPAVGDTGPRVLIVLHVGNKEQGVNDFYIDLLTRLLARYDKRYRIDVHVSIITELADLAPSVKRALYSERASLTVEVVPNLGADLYPFIDLVCKLEGEYALALKFHTKSMPQWSLDLVSSIADLDNVWGYFCSHPSAGVVGAERWLIPTFCGTSVDYNRQLRAVGQEYFQYDIGDDTVDNTAVLQSVAGMDAGKFREHHLHLYRTYTKRSEYNAYADNLKRSGGFHPGLYDLRHCPIAKYVGGTIFALRGELLVRYQSCKVGLTQLMNTIEQNGEVGYISDQQGTKFTYTHGAERLIQLLAYKFGYEVTGLTSSLTNLPPSQLVLPVLPAGQRTMALCTANLDDNEHNSELLCLAKNLRYSGWSLVVLALNGGSLRSRLERYVPVMTLATTELAAYQQVIRQLGVKVAYGNSLTAFPWLHGAHQARCRTICSVPETEAELLALYHYGLLPTYDFTKVIDLCLCNEPRVAALLSSWRGSTGGFIGLNPQLPFEVLVRLNPTANSLSTLTLESHPEVPMDVVWLSHGITNLLDQGVRSLEGVIADWYHRGYKRGLPRYRPPIRCKQTLLMVLHEGTLTGAPKVGCLLATQLQRFYNVVVLTLSAERSVLTGYLWEQPVICDPAPRRHTLHFYLERLETAHALLGVLKPDLVYVNSISSHVYYQAATNKGIPVIYHTHEGEVGFEECLSISATIKDSLSAPPPNTIFYSCSPTGADCLRTYLKLPASVPVKQIQVLDLAVVKQKSLEPCPVVKRAGRRLYGMVGPRAHRKGFDIFVALARDVPDCDFLWLGATTNETPVTTDIENLTLLETMDNPYGIIAQLDTLLLTSREDLAPLVVAEAVTLGVHVILPSENISCWQYYKELGCTVIEGRTTSVELWLDVVNQPDNYRSVGYNLERLLEHDISQTIQTVVADASKLTNGLLTPTLRPLYPHWKTGYAIYDSEKVAEIFTPIARKWDANVYADKYQDLATAGLVTPEQLYDHWLKVGHKSRNCDRYDWKLYLTLHPELVAQADPDALRANGTEVVVHFNPEQYANRYPDLQKLTAEQLLIHWQRNGVWEGRCCLSL
jgi:hypothetical protein